MKILGIFYFSGYNDPSAAVTIDGEIISFVEEERLVRNKHANSYFPSRSIDFVLKSSKLDITDIDKITIGWDCDVHENGELKDHFNNVNSIYPPTKYDKAYQKRRISNFSTTAYESSIIRQLRKMYGDIDLPKIVFIKHHLAHATMAYFHSGFDETLVLTIDGSGELSTTTWWIGKNSKLTLLNEIKIPHSLGWFYSAFTEYLGYEAYDGEYKVMGLAAYGKNDSKIEKKLREMIWYDNKGGFETDPTLFSMGERSFSNYYCDKMVNHIGEKPRSKNEELNQWHINLAYEVQKLLEEIVTNMAKYWISETGINKLAIAGGVGLNVKMNGNLYYSGILKDIFIHPLSSDTGMPIGSAMGFEYLNNNLLVDKIKHVNFGPSYDNNSIEKVLKNCKVNYSHEKNIEKKVAKLISDGAIVGWFQNQMEAGPRALGNRSILADPRNVESRDKVNAVVKFREFWRPFCPSMTYDAANKYLDNLTDAPFMIITFKANKIAEKEIPAVVHTDNTSRIQIVGDENKIYKKLLAEFGEITGIPVLLNTSFNIKGEPIVCTPHDAIRTFFATGLDALALGSFLLVK
tara:strand:- start:1 stop:1725 length:1725 start_codon:yes stop_codon:yes gene_type:complete